MEKLREELERKRKNVAETFGGRKYMKRSEIEQRELHSLREQEHKELSSKKSASSSSSAPPPPYPDAGPHLIDPPALSSRPRPPPSKLLSEEDKIDELVLPKSEVVRRLRMLKHPVTLFGEDDDARLDRLKSLLKAGVSDPDNELMEGQRNDFLKDITQLNKMEKSGGRKEKDSGGLEDGMDRGDLSADGGSSGKDNHDKDAKRMRSDFGSLCNEDKILVFFKRHLQEWEQELEDRPDAEKRSGKGKQMVAIYKQCVRYLTPLFKMCRKRLLPSDICRALMVVVDCCMKRDYLAAMDQYIKLAIGNAPWPIGVTMVGIHERSAREKIYTNSVAHIMNDETTRKYLQSIKRLMTLCQRRYPSAPSKSVEFNSLANGSDLQSLLAEETVRTGNQAVEEQLRLMNAPANNTQSL